MRAAQSNRSGFSLIELVIVVVIIGIIGAIAIPRLSRGSAGAADNALRGNLAVLRNAIELYAAEHDGKYPAAATVVDQLTLYSDFSGNTSATRGGAFIYGPYLKSVPPLPVGAAKGRVGIATDAGKDATTGWIYEVDANGIGEIRANTTDLEMDVSGVKYNTY